MRGVLIHDHHAIARLGNDVVLMKLRARCTQRCIQICVV